jgi:hypothetical protein
MAFDTMANQKESVLQVGSYKDKILESIQKIGDKSPSGNTVFWHAIEQAGLALSAIDNVERKHVILVSDGQPGDPYEEYSAKIRENLEKGITLSIVTTSILKDYEQAMKDAAALGEGGFYNVTSSELETLPQIMEKDLKLEVIPDIAYGEAFVPTIKDKTPVVAGITQESIPSLTGYYGTLAKKDAFVPLMGQYVPIYAHWKYGRGNVGSFMCDLNGEWSAEFLTKPGGQALINNIVHNIFPMEDVVADGVRYDIKTDNYTTQLNVYGIEEGEQIRVEINPLSEDLFDLRDKGIAVHAAESNRRFTFAIKDAGLYEIKIIKLDAAGNQLSETVIYRTFSYSEEYNAFPEREPVKDALLAVLATDGRGVVVAPDEPAQVFESFEKTLLRTFDPRVLFLILIIVFLLVDIAVRKFKFKWIHELIRERRMKKAENTLKDE